MLRSKVARTLFLTALIPALLAGCGGGGSGGDGDGSSAEPAVSRLLDAQALSNHYVEVTFAEPAGAAAEAPNHYVISDPDGAPLAVEAARLSADRTQAILTTEAQEDVMYRLSLLDSAARTAGGVDAVSTNAEINFAGSLLLEPFLASAISLSATEVLLTFSDRMDDGTADNEAFYEIAEPDLAVTAATLQAGGTTVILTTSEQENIEYTVKVTNLESQPGGKLINPLLNAASFSGIPLVDTDAPRVVSAEATGATTVVVSFSEPLADGADDPTNFTICIDDNPADNSCSTEGEQLVVTDAALSTHNTQVVLTTLPQTAAIEYTVEVANVVDRASPPPPNSIGSANFATFTFAGLEPFLASAISLSATEVLLTFSERMDPATAENAAFYEIAEPDLAVTNASLQAGGTTVILTTSEQDNVEYTVKVTNVENQVGGQLINSLLNAASFSGIPPVDTEAPRVVSVESTGPTTVLVSFSEPLADGADDPSNFTICIDENPADNSCSAQEERLVITAAILAMHNTQVVLTTLPQTAGIGYAVGVTNVVDQASPPPPNAIDPLGDFPSFTFGGTPGVSDGETPPRVVGAASAGNNSVIVAFSKPMGDSALVAGSYVIVQENVNPEVGALIVVDDPGDPGDDPQFLEADRTAVKLTTLSQNEVTYTVTAVNVKDLAGNPLAPKQVVAGLVVDPTSAMFPGTPPGPGELVDSDGDGLTDNIEQRGWVVTVILVDGTPSTREVTSDPGDPTLLMDHPDNIAARDTDSDGLSDQLERLLGSDPRQADTDGDSLSDDEEYNAIFSNQNVVDTDEDGIDDFLEVEFFKTNALLADSDGDGFSDAQELFEMNRDPRIADLPRQGITVGEVALRIDERFTSTNEQGETITESSSTGTTLSSGTENSLSQSDSRTAMILVEGNVSGGKGETDTAKKFIKGSLTVTGGGEFTSSTTRESARQAEQAFENSLEKGQELSDSLAVTREVVGAGIEASVTLANLSGVAFALQNIEISVFATDPQDRDRFLPIATLVPNSTLITGEPVVFNLGPLEPTRGPILFSSREVFPNLVEDLMRDPRGLIFRVANVDLTDEFGRNFAFASQVARDRTAGLVVDFGDGTVERYLMSTAAVRERRCVGGTRDGELCSDDGDCPGAGAVCEDRGIIGGHSDFSGTGTINGITIDFALQDILGLKKNNTGPDGIIAGPDGSVQTFAAGDDVQLVPAGIDGVPEDTIVIVAGENGILDTAPVAGDVAAVVTGYATTSTCGAGTPRVIRSGPDGLADTPKDPASDDVQLAALGAMATDVIGPGLNGVIDSIEQGDDIFVSPGILCGNDAACFGGLCDGPEALFRFKNRQVGDTGRVWTLIVPRLPTEILVGDDRIGTDFGSLRMRPGETVGLAFVRDSDRDGLIAQEEFLFGSSDNDQDSDNDHLDDFAEVKVGWEVDVPGSPLRRVFPNPARADSDGDGLIDYEEMDLRQIVTAGDFNRDPGEPFATDPRLSDTDNDFAGDFEEVFGYLIGAAVVEPIINQMIIAGADGVADTIACPLQICAGGTRQGQSCRNDHDCPSSSADRQVGAFFDTCNLTPACDDIQIVAVGARVPERTVVVAPGGNGVLESTLDPFDELVTVADGAASTLAVRDDRQVKAVGAMVAAGDAIVRPGVNGFIDALTAGDDVILLGSNFVMTDPLDRDFDFDAVSDGVERRLGSDPTNPNDGDDFLDTDDDGLTDDEEVSVGWMVTVTLTDGTVVGPRPVFSNPNVGDSDFDGLPDFVERQLPTDPTSEDTDGDTLSDFDELSADIFDEFAGLDELLSGFRLGSGSDMLGTDPTKQDSDGDGIADNLELDGYVVVLPGQGSATQVVSDPVACDTDYDGLSDGVERRLETDANVADTDGDGRIDGVECCPGADLTICPNAVCDPVDVSACTGGNPRLPDARVTVTFVQIDAQWGSNAGGEWWWHFYIQKSGEAFPGLLVSDPESATPGCYGFTSTCDWCAQGSVNAVALNNSRELTLMPGEGLVVNGIAAELQVGACGRAKNEIVQLGRDLGGDDDQCSMVLPATSFRYEDLVSSGFQTQQIQFEKGSSNNEAGCQGSVVIEIQVE